MKEKTKLKGACILTVLNTPVHLLLFMYLYTNHFTYMKLTRESSNPFSSSSNSKTQRLVVQFTSQAKQSKHTHTPTHQKHHQQEKGKNTNFLKYLVDSESVANKKKGRKTKGKTSNRDKMKWLGRVGVGVLRVVLCVLLLFASLVPPSQAAAEGAIHQEATTAHSFTAVRSDSGRTADSNKHSRAQTSDVVLDAGNTVGRDGHVIIVVEEDVTAFESHKLYEVSVGAKIFRLVFSPKLMLVEEGSSIQRGGLLSARDELQLQERSSSIRSAPADEIHFPHNEQASVPMLLCRLPTLSLTENVTTTTTEGTGGKTESQGRGRRVAAEEEPSFFSGIGSRVSSTSIESLLLEDEVLRKRVAHAIESELSDEPCVRTRWALGGSAPFASPSGAHETYELCYGSHFKRVGEPKQNQKQYKVGVDSRVDDDDQGEVEENLAGEGQPLSGKSGADNKKKWQAPMRLGSSESEKESAKETRPDDTRTQRRRVWVPPAPTEIILGLRKGSDLDATRSAKRYFRELQHLAHKEKVNSGGPDEEADFEQAFYAARPSEPSRDVPFFNQDTGRWELLLGGGDPCIRHVDLSHYEEEKRKRHTENGRREQPHTAVSVPFQTRLFFTCGRRKRLLDTSINTMSTNPRIVINRDIGRCEYSVGIEASAVCEWDAHLRSATISPILCSRI